LAQGKTTHLHPVATSLKLVPRTVLLPVKLRRRYTRSVRRPVARSLVGCPFHLQHQQPNAHARTHTAHPAHPRTHAGGATQMLMVPHDLGTKHHLGIPPVMLTRVVSMARLPLAVKASALVDLAASSDPADCADRDASCSGWAHKGECERNPGFMRATCMVACAVCQGDTSEYTAAFSPSLSPLQASPSSPGGTQKRYSKQRKNCFGCSRYSSNIGRLCSAVYGSVVHTQIKGCVVLVAVLYRELAGRSSAYSFRTQGLQSGQRIGRVCSTKFGCGRDATASGSAWHHDVLGVRQCLTVQYSHGTTPGCSRGTPETGRGTTGPMGGTNEGGGQCTAE
jgi:hypothetical protein